MAVRSNRKTNRPARRRTRPLSVLTVFVAFALSCAVVLTSLTPKRYEVTEGSAAKETITAPRNVEDVATTEALRQAARSRVSAVYTVDAKLADSLVSGAGSFFTALDSFQKTANDLKTQTAPSQTLADGTVALLEDTRTWQEVISQDTLLGLLLKLPVSITDTTMGYALLETSDGDLASLKKIVTGALKEKLNAGVSEKELPSTLAAITKELNVTTLPVRLKSLGETLYTAYLQPTYVEDATVTLQAREKAAAEVKAVYLPRGSTIVEQGQTVTKEQMQVLTSLDLVKGANVNGLFTPGIILYLFIVYGMLLAYLRVFEYEVFSSGKRMLLLLLILCLTLALEWLCYLIDPRVTPALFGVLLCAILLSRSVAQSVNVALAMTLCILSGGGGANLLTSDSLLSLAAMLVTGQTTIVMVEKSDQRGALIGSGALGGISGGLIVVAGSMALGTPWSQSLIYGGEHAATCLVLSVFCVGMLSVWENLFDIVTNAWLHELANTNHPLLKKLMTSAPGTYHHSMMTASLAEGAAQAVNANALLARTGALYHDVGKLRRPLYFKENQTDGRNIHDSLPPEESAGYIIAHVKDADALLSKYRLPLDVRRIAAEHHGNTLVAYFYYKAKKQQEIDGQPVIERLFRYQGDLPSTKESAIVMLADSCEAAVRSLNDPTRDEAAEMIHKLVQGKLDDGQLQNCPLTLADISRIERSFCVTIGGLMHERIRYPGGEEDERT